MPRALRLFFVAAMLAASAACQTLDEPTWEAAREERLREANYQATAALMRQTGLPASTSNRLPGSDAPFIVATLANVNALEQSSTLGRVISEHIGSWLTQSGRQVVEMKVRNSIYMKRNEGEFLLTREIREVAAAHDAQGVVVGTYAEGVVFLHVSLKLVDPANSQVLAAHDYTLPLDRQIKSLLRAR